MRARKMAMWLGCERQRGARACGKQHAWLFMAEKPSVAFALNAGRWCMQVSLPLRASHSRWDRFPGGALFFTCSETSFIYLAAIGVLHRLHGLVG